MTGEGTTPVRVRAARQADAEAIAAVEVDAWHSAYAGILPDSILAGMTEASSAREWRALMANPERPDHVLVAALPAGEVVGFGSCGPERTSGLGHTGEIYTLYVAPDWQGWGLGERLLRALMQALFERGARDAVVWVLAANPSRFFYERMGGRQVAGRRQTIGGQAVDELAYAWADLTSWRPGGTG